ncbi:MAG: triose-phosphate isomerase [Limnochordaceae bacterium]|nr:triose-phosphate isomerase [Limnochordaceae bacterium]
MATHRTRLMAGNWKMNKVPSEARAFTRQLLGRLEAAGRPEGVEVLLCPPFPALTAVHEEIVASGAGDWVQLGAQNLYFETHGAFTGEVAGPMLADAGCRYVIVGHSERRHLFGESDETVARKVKAAFGAGLVPILCVGETIDQRRQGQTEAVIRRQLEVALAGLDEAAVAGMVIAYEPVWAIGTGENATPEEAHRVIQQVIRQRVRELTGQAAAERVRIQYGGSVNATNIADFMALDGIDGALVGGASLKVDSFTAIVAAGRRKAA